jgi:hypothetical protein
MQAQGYAARACSRVDTPKPSTSPPQQQAHLPSRPILFSTKLPYIKHYSDSIDPPACILPRAAMSDPERDHALGEYKTKLLDSREWEAKLKALRLEIKGLQRDYDVSEDNIKALQSVGQIIGEVLKQLDDERCMQLQNGTSLKRTNAASSHRQSIVRAAICRWL